MDKYSSISKDTICRAKRGQEDCDAFVLGHLVKQLRCLQIWPGNPNDILHCLNDKSIVDIYTDIRAIHDFMRPHGGKQKYFGSADSMMHIECGCTGALIDLSKAALNASGMSSMPEPVATHLEVQRQKLEVSKIEMSKFRRRDASMGI